MTEALISRQIYCVVEGLAGQHFFICTTLIPAEWCYLWTLSMNIDAPTSYNTKQFPSFTSKLIHHGCHQAATDYESISSGHQVASCCWCFDSKVRLIISLLPLFYYFLCLKHVLITFDARLTACNHWLLTVDRQAECAQAFLRLIRHERDMINARSQDFEHHEITIIQKAFTTFMESAKTLHATIEIYVEESLRLWLSREKNKSLMIENVVNVRAGFLNGMSKI